jgi:hypothetical protein
MSSHFFSVKTCFDMSFLSSTEPVFNVLFIIHVHGTIDFTEFWVSLFSWCVLCKIAENDHSFSTE